MEENNSIITYSIITYEEQSNTYCKMLKTVGDISQLPQNIH